MASVIDSYLNSELPTFLKKYDIHEFVISKIVEDISNRMNSFLVHSSDLIFRRVILSIGLEEATFYEPKGDIELKCFVVATIRNSLFENLVSTKTAAKSLGLEEVPIPESGVKEFTKLAISCLKEVNFDEDILNISLNPKNNLFSELPGKYPVAWRALSELGKWSNKGQRYDGLNLGALELPELISGISVLSKAPPDHVDIQSGMDPSISDELSKILYGLSRDYQPVFYTDCFKMLTRNVDKLFKIIEYVLRKDCIFLTSNFLISNGYVSKRRDLLPPAHTTKEAREHLNNFSGLHKAQFKVFKAVSQSLLNQ